QVKSRRRAVDVSPRSAFCVRVSPGTTVSTEKHRPGGALKPASQEAFFKTASTACTPGDKTMTIWALIAYVLGAAVVGTIIGCVVSPAFRRNVLILLGKGNNKLTTPIDRELALIAEQEEIVSKAARKASDLRGTLNNERNKLADKNRALETANGDLDLAISMAKNKNANIT
ncbi:hypothetical protein B7486_78385, partial [cyanobacterium TDX16]